MIDAVQKLKQEGLLVELILLEKSNEKIGETMQTVDILAEQFMLLAMLLAVRWRLACLFLLI